MANPPGLKEACQHYNPLGVSTSWTLK